MNPFLALPGAVPGDAGAALHYGEPIPEQRALEAGAAIVDLSHRGVVIVSGPDRLSWLHSMTSQGLAKLPVGESAESMLLDANGRIETVFRIVDDGERAWLLVDEGAAEHLAGYLTRMRFALRVEVRDASDEFAAVLAFDGGPAAEALRALEPVAEWRDPWSRVAPGGTQYAHEDADSPHPGADWRAVQFVLPRERLGEAAALAGGGAAGVRAAGTLALDALEVRAWRPSQHADADERAIPHEFDWLRTAVHLNKGCYRGQETIAKVHNLGHPPRRLAMLHLDGSGGELPGPGALVFTAGEGASESARPVGRVTRAVLHHEWGGIALALLKRSVPEDAALEVRIGEHADDPKQPAAETIAAAQEAIVPRDAGATRRDDIAARFSRRPR